MAPPGRPNMTSVPSISRLLMSAWAPVICMVRPFVGKLGFTRALKNPPHSCGGSESAARRERLGALRNYENGGVAEHGPQFRPRAGEFRNRYRHEGVVCCFRSQSTMWSAPIRPFFVSMKVWPASGTMSTVTDGELKNSPLCMSAYCGSKNQEP